MRRLALSFALASLALAGDPKSPSAFEFGENPRVKTAIDRKEILKGLSLENPRDGIATIRKPEAIPAARATWLEPEDRVLGVTIGGEARAYPLEILEVHELVNDVLGGRPIAPNY